MSFLPFIIVQVVVIIGLVIGLRRLLRRNLTEATTHLQGLNAEYAKRQEELKQRLEQAEQQYREQMMRAKGEAEVVVAQAKQEAESSKARMLEEARAESERIVQQGLASREAMRREIEQTMEVRAIERACELIQVTLPGELRQEMQSHWLDELIHNGLGVLEPLPMDESVQEAKVISAFALNDRQRQALREHLGKKLGREITLVEETDARLVAGLVINLGSLVLDGSLASKVRQAARRAQSTG